MEDMQHKELNRSRAHIYQPWRKQAAKTAQLEHLSGDDDKIKDRSVMEQIFRNGKLFMYDLTKSLEYRLSTKASLAGQAGLSERDGQIVCCGD